MSEFGMPPGADGGSFGPSWNVPATQKALGGKSWEHDHPAKTKLAAEFDQCKAELEDELKQCEGDDQKEAAITGLMAGIEHDKEAMANTNGLQGHLSKSDRQTEKESMSQLQAFVARMVNSPPMDSSN